MGCFLPHKKVYYDREALTISILGRTADAALHCCFCAWALILLCSSLEQAVRWAIANAKGS